MRLNRFLASAGVASRRKSEEYILTGRIMVNGKVVTELACTVDPGKDKVTFDGDPVVVDNLVYIVMNKPEGVITSANDEFGRPTVLDMLPPMKAKLYPVGRLDADTTGLLLLTNDGELAYRLSHPSFEISKTYRVLMRGKLEPDAVSKLESGVWLAEGKTKSAKISNVHSSPDKSICDVTISEGLNRQVRRMFAKVDMKVKHIARISIGPIELGDLPVGKLRPLTADEVTMLRNAVKTKARSFKLDRDRKTVIRSKKTPRPTQAPFKGGKLRGGRRGER